MATTPVIDSFYRKQLLSRRKRIEQASRRSDAPSHLGRLLTEVDNALGKMDDGSYGICEICHEPVEADRLVADPIVRICLEHFTEQERAALERDLELAAQVQKTLLPEKVLRRDGWHICFHYEPAGVVSGDYCDIVDAADGSVYFIVGDVSGKGLAASMLMAHLHAMFRTLISVEVPLCCMLEHASRVFAQSTLPNQYATLVCGRAAQDGSIELVNAGHPAPLVLHQGVVGELGVSDLPIGLFASEEFSVNTLQLESGDGLVIYSDGVSEATDLSGIEYTPQRLQKILGDRRDCDAAALLSACREDLSRFRGHARKNDDVTLFVLSRL